MNSALAMMAPTAASATAPAIMSFGLCKKRRSKRPCSTSASTATALEPRRGGMSSSLINFLGTLFHLDGLFWGGWTGQGGERCDVVGGFRGLRRQWQSDRHGGSFVDLALHGHLAAMH